MAASVVLKGNIKGPAGRGVTSFDLNSTTGNLTVTYTDSSTQSIGIVKGAAGVGIQSASVNSGGDLTLTLTDGSTLQVGNIKGGKGDTGAQGTRWYISNTTPVTASSVATDFPDARTGDIILDKTTGDVYTYSA